MSELQEAISEMRNMRESYDQIGAAAEAYNVGKTELAANITAKGVQASADETLPELAEKVSAIAQESYTIDGGEMYAKQLFGSLTTPNYWNLYEVLANLLSDGRLVSYGGILLAEYYKGYDSLALAGAGAGGAYVVSDKDENGQFKMYTEDTTHVWATEFDGKGNRWVAYCFADEYHDFQITDTNTSPRSIFIGRKVGTITSLVNYRTSQVVVPDGNELRVFNGGEKTNGFGKKIILRNIGSVIGLGAIANTEAVYTDANQCEGMIGSSTSLSSIIISPQTGEIKVTSSITYSVADGATLIVKAREISGQGKGFSTFRGYYNSMIFLGLEELTNPQFGTLAYGAVKYLYFGYDTNNKNKLVYFYIYGPAVVLEKVELQDGWCKPFRIYADIFPVLTENSIYTYILQRLKQDEPNCGNGVTITLGTDILNKLTSEESQELLALLRGTYGYTFA